MTKSIESIYLLYPLDFEWDLKKASQNKRKHGISFLDAIEIWQNKHLTVEGIAYSEDGEERSATIGIVSGIVYTAIWTRRNKRIRLISVRRARKHEQKVYQEKAIQNF